MATWKRFTGAVDSSAQSFLKNKRFSREKRKFTWDWHAWNLVLVSTPSLLLGIYLHRVEKRMNEASRVREEIQERTGVSSRGFLIPQRKLREEVMGTLSAGNQPTNISEAEERETPVRIAPSEGHGGSETSVPRDNKEGQVSPDVEMLRRRLEAIEKMLKLDADVSSAGKSVEDRPETATRTSLSGGAGSGPRMEDVSTSTLNTKVTSGTDSVPETAVEKTLAMASAAGRWAVTVGGRQGKRLLQMGRDWLADEDREDGVQSGNARVGMGGNEELASEKAGAEVVGEGRSKGAQYRAGQIRGRGEGSASEVGDAKRHEEEASRRGSSNGKR